jgi:two-component system response regulator HydG
MAIVLVVDDEEPNRVALERVLAREGWGVVLAGTGREALEILRGGHEVGVVVTDLKMPGMDGLELLKLVRQLLPEVQVIVATAFGTVERAVEAMKEGAYDFVTKPLKRAEVVASVGRALEKHSLLMENRRLKEQIGKELHSTVIGQSSVIRLLLEEAELVARSVATVLITGESGTGKGLFARWLHARSGRQGRLVTVNCGAIPESLIESELFGHEAGAFTGAGAKKEGRFELAAGGTIFLDEIAEVSHSMQVKLLRVLQDGEYERVGGTRTLQSTARVLAGTNRDPLMAVQEGKLREDLYYRLNVIPLHMPPLRERREDIVLLARHFAALHARRNNREIEGFEPEALLALERYTWPGNVRELENAIERAVVLCRGGGIRLAELPAVVRGAEGVGSVRFQVGTTLREVERRMIEETLKVCGGDKGKAAAMLGIAARTISRREAEWEEGEGQLQEQD